MTTTGPGSSGPDPDDGPETPAEPTEMPDQAPAPAREDPVSGEEPMATQPGAAGTPPTTPNSQRSIPRSWWVAGIAIITAAVLSVCNVVGRVSDQGGDTQSEANKVAPSATSSTMFLGSYSIRVIDPMKVDYRKWQATVYAHDACSSKEIKERAQQGVVVSGLPIQEDGTIRVQLIPGNYAVGIGNGTNAYGHLLVEVGGSEDRRFSYDPVSGSCAQAGQAASVIVFSELPNMVLMVPAPTQTPAPAVVPPRTAAPAAPTARPVPSFAFDADASPSSGVNSLASTITTRVTQSANISRDSWLISIDCNRDGTFEYTNARTGRIGSFGCAYSVVGTHSWYVRAVLEEDGSVVREDFGTVTVTAPAVATPAPTTTTTTTDSIQFDLVPARTVASGPNGFQSTISVTALNVRGPGIANGYTVSYSFDCDSNGSPEYSTQTSGGSAQHTCSFSGGSGATPQVTITVVVRANGTGSSATKTTSLGMTITN